MLANSQSKSKTRNQTQQTKTIQAIKHVREYHLNHLIVKVCHSRVICRRDDLWLFFAFVVGLTCSNQQNPFKRVPIESFIPPKNASYKDSIAWTEAVDDMKRSVSKLKYGGEPLQKYIRSEIMRLEQLRMELFCQYLWYDSTQTRRASTEWS